MEKVSITHRRCITLNMDAKDWGLYTNMEGVEEVAKQINHEVEHEIGRAETRGFAARQIGITLEKFSKYGATDTEPVSVAHQILDKAYPEYSGWETRQCV